MWLDPAQSNADLLLPALRTYPAEEMTAVPVGPRVNSPRHAAADCLAESA